MPSAIKGKVRSSMTPLTNESNPAAPQVSVIVAVKEGSGTLQRCLDSIAAQDFGSRETIVVDGASTDGTRELLESNARQGKLDSYVSEPDRGVYQAWNKGILRSRGVWICFLGCDDVFHDVSSLRALADAGARAGGARVVYGKIERVAANGVLVETIGVPWEQAREGFLAGINIPHPGTLHHRSIFTEGGRFDESYRIAGDYDLLLGELRERAPAFVDRVVVDMGLGGLSSRPGSIYQALREVSRARAAHGLRGTPARLRVALTVAWCGSWIYRFFGARAYAQFADLYRTVRGRPKIWTA
jgi:glycosyltransferase involved in cell wall biosynthesis